MLNERDTDDKFSILRQKLLRPIERIDKPKARKILALLIGQDRLLGEDGVCLPKLPSDELMGGFVRECERGAVAFLRELMRPIMRPYRFSRPPCHLICAL